MNRYDLVSLMALLVLVTALPLYALREPERMVQAKDNVRRQVLADAARLYLNVCAGCHGVVGEGLGTMPPLNSPKLAQAGTDALFNTIAPASHGTSMAAWHIDEGGILTSNQIKGLVTLIRHADWTHVAAQAEADGFNPPTPSTPNVETVSLAAASGAATDPHQCRACHDEPALHIDRFGLDCARCHTLETWIPARLTRHIFRLDHGGSGTLACKTCHTETYGQHSCYQCHDHQPDDIRQTHVQADILTFDTCIDCHPTGLGNEADRLAVNYKE